MSRKNRPRTLLRHRRRWTRDDRAGTPWPSLRFEVPDGCAALAVDLLVEQRPGTVLDLGCAGAHGWRGWSGGARRGFRIGANRATPGYLPGPPEPGWWAVVLGLHRIPAEGVECTVLVRQLDAVPKRVGDTPDTPRRCPHAAWTPRPRLPAPSGLQWIAADLHAHSTHSDGYLNLDELACRARCNGLDLLAVTDHNTVSHHRALPNVGRRHGIGLLPGQEVTTDSGHAGALGDIGWVDFRRPAAAWVREVEQRGGLMSINHPLARSLSWRHPLPARPPLAEVWHSGWRRHADAAPLAWWRAWGMDTTPVGGSDFHHPGDHRTLGDPTTWIAVDAAAEGPDELPHAALQGLRAGRTAVHRGGPAPHRRPLLLPVDGELLALRADGALLVAPDGSSRPVHGERTTFRPGGAGGHVLRDHQGATLALCAAPR